MLRLDFEECPHTKTSKLKSTEKFARIYGRDGGTAIEDMPRAERNEIDRVAKEVAESSNDLERYP
eukprot:11600708-Karenia_brevis.AAC.1